MEMEKLIARINELARKSKGTGLTEEEAKEQAALRQQYLAVFRANLTAQLDNTYLVRPDGSKEKLKRN